MGGPGVGTSARAARLLAVAGTVACSCGGSFAIEPTEVPRLNTGVVRDVEGESREVPARWTARVLPRDPPGVLRVGDPVDRQIASEDSVEFSSPAEAGLAPLGQGLDASRGSAPRGPVALTAPSALWLRNDEGRIVEIPLSTIDRVVVRGQGDGIGPGAIVAIVVGSMVGAAAFGLGIYALAATLDAAGGRE